MKNSDIATVIVIAALSMLAAYFVADAVIGQPGTDSVKVKTVDPISSDVAKPDPAVFNKNAINPTVEVIIGQGTTNR